MPRPEARHRSRHWELYKREIPYPAKQEPYRNAINRRDAEIAEISAEKTQNRVTGESGIRALTRAER